MAQSYRPTARQTAILIGIGAVALVCAFLMRYRGIENSPFGLACQADGTPIFCRLRALTLVLFEATAFGTVALVAALVNLCRPSLVFSSIALAAAGLGIVLYNINLSALAIGLLILSLARPARAREPA